MAPPFQSLSLYKPHHVSSSNLFNSWVALILHPSLSWTWPKLFLRIFQLKIIKYCIFRLPQSPSFSCICYNGPYSGYIHFNFGLIPSELWWKRFFIHKEALFPFFILVKISSLFTLLSYVTDPRKPKVCSLSKLCCRICTFISLFLLLRFALISKYFVFSWLFNPSSFAFSFTCVTAKLKNALYCSSFLSSRVTILLPPCTMKLCWNVSKHY